MKKITGNKETVIVSYLPDKPLIKVIAISRFSIKMLV